MTDNKGNEFKKALNELREKAGKVAEAKFRVFDRPASARPAPVKYDLIPLKKLIANAIPKPVDKPVARASARPVARPASTRPVARPATARQRAGPAISLRNLIPDIMGVVEAQLSKAEKSKYTLDEYKFVDGIPEEKIIEFHSELLQNKNALYYLTEKNYIVNPNLEYNWLSSNTNPIAIKLIKKALESDINTHINWEELCKNPSAADILLNGKYREKLVWDALSRNTNPRVIRFLSSDRNFQHIIWENLSANEAPEAIALLEERIKTHPWNITRNQITRNSGAIAILKVYKDKVTGDGLSANKAEAAFNLLLKILEVNPKDINWAALSANPSKWAFDFLQKEENKKNIRWDMVSKNTSKSAIQLLKKRVEEENKLSDDEYKLLAKNKKIDWLEVSKNPSAIDLIIERIKYEEILNRDKPEYYRNLNPYEKISYSGLATNPSIFVKVGRTRPVAAPAISPVARRASPVSPAARRASPASRASPAARVSAARVANNAKFNAELEKLRAQHKQLQNASLASLASQTAQTARAPRASRTQQSAARTTSRTLRAQTLAAYRAEYRDIGRPSIRQPLRASNR